MFRHVEIKSTVPDQIRSFALKILSKRTQTRHLKVLNYAESVADHKNLSFKWNQLELTGIFLNLS